MTSCRTPRTSRSSAPALLGTGLVAVAALLSGCAASGADAATPGSAASPSRSGGPAVSSSPVATTVPAPAGSASPGATPPSGPSSGPDKAAVGLPSGLAWRSSPSSSAVQVATVDGGRISLMWMDPSRLRFRFVPGYQVPEGGPSAPADSTPSTWVPNLVAGFDSGYKLSDHVGGYYYLGRTVSRLRTGYASMVVHRDGTLTVGVWGEGLSMTPDTLVVRQNLPPLVDGGVSRASSHDSARTWGISNGNRPLANRSALARLANGTLVFAYAHDVTAATLGSALVAIGARQAIMLDMNISWPTGFVYAHHGSTVTGSRINSHILRPPSTYLSRFKKDFIAVESRPA